MKRNKKICKQCKNYSFVSEGTLNIGDEVRLDRDCEFCKFNNYFQILDVEVSEWCPYYLEHLVIG